MTTSKTSQPHREPTWPDVLPDQLIEEAFRDRVIDTPDHPAVKRLPSEPDASGNC